ncbi:unnamed protein product [Thelazia callipaeda]|uniref:SAS-6_N domain-containing protein n=1 Tax=Thelazia callipaeda TaxID=103827 RepID=A0A0N5D5H1_THECL|nr:unnamed protein product [Thelazia callipaeda]
MNVIFKIDERQNRAEKEYMFCISRSDDPLFIYTLTLRRTDYESLKRDQELDVDFDAFPKKIIDFITSLDSSSGSYLRGNGHNDNDTFRFELVGKMGFKWVTILSLSLQKLTDKALTMHLAEKILKDKEYLKEMDALRDLFLAEQADNNSLRNSLLMKETIHEESMRKWDEERSEITECVKKLEVLNEELTADKELQSLIMAYALQLNQLFNLQMLTQEVSTLKEEAVDFRDRIDDLMEQLNQLEGRIQFFTEELAASENRFRNSEQRKEELELELRDKEEETRGRVLQLRELRDAINDVGKENDELCEKMVFLKKDRDHWQSEHNKAVSIIKKLYGDKTRRDVSGEYEHLNEKVIELEKDLVEREKTINDLRNWNAELKKKLENASSECENAKKDAEAWKVKCDRKESVINDLIQSRRSSPVVSPLQQTGSNFGNVTPSFYPRVLGVANWTAQITTPLRNVGAVSKTTDQQKENELNSVAVTPPTGPQILLGMAKEKI